MNADIEGILILEHQFDGFLFPFIQPDLFQSPELPDPMIDMYDIVPRM